MLYTGRYTRGVFTGHYTKDSVYNIHMNSITNSNTCSLILLITLTVGLLLV